jgi:integrase
MKENPCKEIPRPKENERDEFLSLSELKKISELNLNIGSMAEGLNLTRDLFLFSCYTGLRYSDVINLQKDEVKKDRIEIVMQKTSKKVEIPLNKKAKEILRRFKGRKFSEQVFPFRSNVSVNRDLKFIARRAKINKRVSFHTGRHTFGSTLAENDVQPFYIMKMMGHSDVRMTNRYVNSDSRIITKAMNKVNFG